jgi:hypothetical protein
MDTRLAHLLKLKAEATRDVMRYVTAKWPPGSNIRYLHRGVTCSGTVASHDMDASMVVVLDGTRKLRVSYAQVKDRRANRL